jgi:hypothetical protein
MRLTYKPIWVTFVDRSLTIETWLDRRRNAGSRAETRLDEASPVRGKAQGKSKKLAETVRHSHMGAELPEFIGSRVRTTNALPCCRVKKQGKENFRWRLAMVPEQSSEVYWE